MSSAAFDFDRCAAPAASLDVLARQRIWPYGCWLWRRLSPAQRRGLSLRELLALLRMGMCAQTILSLLWLCEVVEPGDGGDELTRATLVSVAAANRNSALLTRLLTATGPYSVPMWVRFAARIAAALPAAPPHRALRPLVEQLAQEPRGPTLSRLRLLTGVRHLSAAREDLVDAMRMPAPMVNSLRRWALCAASAAADAVVNHPAVYRATALAPALGLPVS